jgi:hypothetical protein
MKQQRPLKIFTIAFCAVVNSSPTWSCDQPFSVFQNGPNIILQLISKQANGAALTPEETAFMADFNADSDRHVKLMVQYEPVCSVEPDVHGCVSECKDRLKAIVNAAKYL